MNLLMSSGALTLVTFLAIACFGILAFISMRKQIKKTDVPYEAEVEAD